MNYTYKTFLGKVYRVDMRPHFVRRRLVVVLVAAGLFGGVLGFASPYIIEPPDGNDFGCETVGTRCWQDRNPVGYDDL